MNLLLLAAGLGVIAGGSLSVGAAGATAALGGLLTILVISPFIADPLPLPLVLATRGVAALLTVELLWVLLHRAPDLRRPSPLGVPALLVAGAAAALVGLALPGSPLPIDRIFVAIDGHDVARAAAAALAVLGLAALLGRGGLGAVAIGSILLVSAADLVRPALAGPLSSLEQLGVAVLQVALAAAALAIGSAVPAGPPLAGRSDAESGGGDGVGRAGRVIPRTRIPVWPGIRFVRSGFRRRDRTSH